MSGPQFSLEGVLDALAVQPQKSPGAGRTIMFVSARRKEGVTTAASAMARAANAGSVYAIDLDLKRNALARAMSQVEPLGPPIEGRLNGTSFYSVRSPGSVVLPEQAPAFAYRRVGRSRVYAGVFDARALPAGGRVVISSAPHYWNAVRAGGATAVVDAPALERSEIALRVARNMDAVVLLVGAEPGAAPAAIAAKNAIVAAGGNLIGLVYAGATAPVMAIERLLRQAG